LAARRLGPSTQVIGFSINDTLRLRCGIGRALGCPAADVEAWSAGEHGPHAVPLFSLVRVNGAPVRLTASQRAAARRYAAGWYDRWQRLGTGRTSVWTSGHGLSGLITALRDGSGEQTVACVPAQGEYGIVGVALGMPVRLWRGRTEILSWDLADAELRGLRSAASVVRRSVQALMPPAVTRAGARSR